MNMPVCTHFLLGACRFGGACTKIHPGGADARLQAAASAPVCSHYLQGRCAYGAACNKVHLGAEEARQRCLAYSQGSSLPATFGNTDFYGISHLPVGGAGQSAPASAGADARFVLGCSVEA